MDTEARSFLTRHGLRGLIPTLEEQGVTTLDDILDFKMTEEVADSVGLPCETVNDMILDGMFADTYARIEAQRRINQRQGVARSSQDDSFQEVVEDGSVSKGGKVQEVSADNTSDTSVGSSEGVRGSEAGIDINDGERVETSIEGAPAKVSGPGGNCIIH